MAEDINPTRLGDADPWSVVSEAREQRGPIVAAWLIGAIALVCSLRFWTRMVRRGPSAPSHPEPPRAGLSSTPGS